MTAVFVPENACTLTVTILGNGTVALNPPWGVYAQGETVTMTATPATGWAFDRWEGDVSGTANPATITMDSNKAVTAVFGVARTLTTSVQGEGTVNPGRGVYAHGAVVSLTATPAAGWRFDRWEGDLGGSSNPGSLTMYGDKSVTAVFIRTFKLTIAVQPAGSGSVSLSPPGGTYDVGTQVSLTATPETGWRFDRWEGDSAGRRIRPL